MIKFMILGLPRSGTTWAANWLTTDKSICIHDPLNTYHYSELDQLTADGRLLGVSCTGLYLFPDWVNRHPCRKVILHRSPNEIRASFKRNDMSVKAFRPENLNKIEGMHVQWTDLFSNPIPIYNFLLNRPMDTIRHDQLKSMNIQVDLNKTPRDFNLLNRLIKELR